MSDRMSILRQIYRKLDQLPLSFGLTGLDANLENELGGDLNDTLRELRRKSTDDIEEMSEYELYVENRSVYYVLRRFRNSASVNFKYSTGVDGKSVDKTQIPKILKATIDEYDAEFKKWRSNNMLSSSSSGGRWDMTRRENDAELI